MSIGVLTNEMHLFVVHLFAPIGASIGQWVLAIQTKLLSSGTVSSPKQFENILWLVRLLFRSLPLYTPVISSITRRRKELPERGNDCRQTDSPCRSAPSRYFKLLLLTHSSSELRDSYLLRRSSLSQAKFIVGVSGPGRSLFLASSTYEGHILLIRSEKSSNSLGFSAVDCKAGFSVHLAHAISARISSFMNISMRPDYTKNGTTKGTAPDHAFITSSV